MKVYLAGPMTGYPKFNIPAFDSAAEFLRAEGFEVVSPAEVDGPELRAVYLESTDGSHVGLEDRERPYDYYLDRDLDIIETQDIEVIVTLPGWERSPGANREVGFALALGIPRYDFTSFDPILGFQMAHIEQQRATAARKAGAAANDFYDADGKFINYADNPMRQRQATGGVKDSRGKPRVDLLPTKPLLAVGRVLGFGAVKYKPHNWRLGLSWSDTLGSALRHILAFADGEDIDPESGECHIDNALAQLMFQSEYFHTKTGIDDRWSSLPEAAREDAKA
jgi:nucleoside 2-deoxyribosyltransferase